MDRFPSESREKNSKRQGFRAEGQRRGILEPRDGRTPALADKIWCMLLEARVAQPVTETEAVRLARELYGIEASARALPGEYDDNFHLTSADGHAFVLKVMHPARERSFIDLQCRALTHLAQCAPQLPLPRVTPNRSGEQFTSIAAADGSTRLVWLLTFVNGTVLAEVRPHTPELLGDLGRFLGEMDAALQSFTHAAAHRELKAARACGKISRTL